MNTSSDEHGRAGSKPDASDEAGDELTDQVIAFVQRRRHQILFSGKLIVVFAIWGLALGLLTWAIWVLLQGFSPEEFRAIFGV